MRRFFLSALAMLLAMAFSHTASAQDFYGTLKKIKDSGLKVQASIMDDQVRVQGKKIDDLQAVISLCRNDDFGQPLQYINMRD